MENRLPGLPENQLPRLTVKEIQNETLRFFNLEKGLLFTFVALLKRPNDTIDIYLNVDRRRFSNPLQYILIGVALYTVIISVHPSFINTMENLRATNEKTYKPLEEKLNFPIMEPFNRAQEAYLSYQNIFYLILIPIVSFITMILFVKNYNYAENLAINAFIFGTSTWLSFVLSTMTVFLDHFSIMMVAVPIISFVVIGYLYHKVFQESWLKTIGVTMIVLMVLMLLSLIIQFGMTLLFMFT
ncbi:MAG: DUF3667 domain-containing protein [Flavobacteriaceae bacterium]|nr:DUF3667 domain-containing protein [Flavobacteriaceae bacterium]